MAHPSRTVRRIVTRLAPAVVVWGLLLAVQGCDPIPDPDPGAEVEPRRAILVSVDGLNEEILRSTLSPADVPELLRVLEGGSCAAHAVSAFPSLTAPSHATLWTGAYGDVTGVTANTQHRLPRSRHTVLDRVNGYSAEPLSAEPLWITGGRVGIPVAGHHVTQAPRVPGYPAWEGREGSGTEERRAESARALAAEAVSVLNGYNIEVEPQRVLRAGDVSLDDPESWVELASLESGVDPRVFSWETGAGTIHAVLFGEGDAYDRVLLNTEPGIAGGVTARAEPVETEAFEDRELARHFSAALEIPVEEGRVHLRVRLFEVAPDGSDFLLFQPALQIAEANRTELQASYEDAVRGWVGNSGHVVYREGGLGPTLPQGGDGLAEARFMETAELVTRQFMRGSEWLWRHAEPRVLLDYFPLSDTVDHRLLGFLASGWPGYDRELAARVRQVRARAWRLVDMRVGHLRALAEEAGAALFVTGDHGIRVTWNQFLPNVALARAGLLALDSNGEVDLSRTRAVAPNGHWISVNTEDWRGGIVPLEESARVVEEARAVLEAVVDDEGMRVVVRTLTPDEAPEMGMGGPAGGDLYWRTAPGYRSGWARTGPVAGPARIDAGHGFAPDEPDMFTVFCVVGPGFGRGRMDAVATTRVAPTVADYAGLPTPRDAVGESVLSDLLQATPR